MIESTWLLMNREGSIKWTSERGLSYRKCPLRTTKHQCWPNYFHVFIVAKSCPTFVTPWTAVCQASLSFTISRSLLRFMSTESVMLSNHLILYHPLILLSSICPSIRDFSIESALCIRWPRYWSFHISPSNEYSVLISFRIDWFDLFAVQGLSRVFSNNSKPSILWHLILWSPVSCGLY